MHEYYLLELSFGKVKGKQRVKFRPRGSQSQF